VDINKQIGHNVGLGLLYGSTVGLQEVQLAFDDVDTLLFSYFES